MLDDNLQHVDQMINACAAQGAQAKPSREGKEASDKAEETPNKEAPQNVVVPRRTRPD